MSEFEQKQGFSVKKSEIISSSPLSKPNTPSGQTELREISATYDYLKSRVDKLREKNIEVPHLKELVIRNFREWIAVQAIREKKKIDDARETQSNMNGLKKFIKKQ